jgi:hypothetical protein
VVKAITRTASAVKNIVVTLYAIKKHN